MNGGGHHDKRGIETHAIKGKRGRQNDVQVCLSAADSILNKILTFDRGLRRRIHGICQQDRKFDHGTSSPY